EAVNITLNWDSYSEIKDLTTNTNDLRIVGWNIAQNEWVDLGSLETTGDINKGTITSVSFVPNQYEAITIGSKTSEDLNTYEIADAKVIKINLYDTAGRLVKSFRGDSELDLTGMAKGIFITDTYLSNGQRFSKKIFNN